MADEWTYTSVVAPLASRPVARPEVRHMPMPMASRSIKARYDAAQTSDGNARHWQWADNLSARAANSPQVRRTLRNRTRYEIDNNCYASGMVETLADDMVGGGPILQMMTGDDGLDRSLEYEWSQWAEAVMFADKLHTMRQTRACDGETFMFMESNPELGDIQLDLCLYEADQVATPYLYPPMNPRQVDGIVLDANDRPVAYHLLNEHPGDTMAYTLGYEYTSIPSRHVIHWFKRRRPKQFRGVPELTPALPLFAMLRRYGLATLRSAEVAAAFSAVVYTDLPPQNGIEAIEGFESFDYEHGMFNTLPAGWKMGQFDAKQPTANHEMFKRATLEEIARTLRIPYNVASGNSAGYNYASGRLDKQIYFKAVKVDRSRADREICNRVLMEWLEEAAKATSLVKGGLGRPGGWPHRWIWPAEEHVDPKKEADAQQVRLQSMTTTFTEECYKDGVDPETRLQTISREIQRCYELGIPSPYDKPTAGSATQLPAPPDDEDQQDEGDGDGSGNDSVGGSGGTGTQHPPGLGIGANGYLAGRNGFHRS